MYKITTMTGGAEREAEILRNQILNSPDSLEVTGDCYYISNGGDDSNDGKTPQTAWKTVQKLIDYYENLKRGDTVLFERGSIFRMNDCIVVKQGVSYGAYGKGPKPELWGCNKNYADPSLWEKCEQPNIWKHKVTVGDGNPLAFCRDFVGNMVFDFDKYVGIFKFDYEDIENDYDYYYDIDSHTLYLKMSKGNPGELFEDIEICFRRPTFAILRFVKDIVIDNICMKYTGSGCVEANYGFNRNITITNCICAWWGGVLVGDGKGDRRVRAGNAIGSYNDVSDWLIQNNWIYQGFDSGISPQGNAEMVCDNYKVLNNLIEYCTWSYEQWVGNSFGMMSNNLIKDNIMRFAGYGWCVQRVDPDHNSHFNAFTYDLWGCFDNYRFVDNILDCSSHALVAWHWPKSRETDPKSPYFIPLCPGHTGVTISGNTFYQKGNGRNWAMWYGADEEIGLQKADNQQQLEDAVKVFDKNPKLVKWLER